MFCSECGGSISDDARFCGHCGAQQTDDKQENGVHSVAVGHQEQKSANKSKKTIMFTVMILVLCSIFLGILLSDSAEEKDDSSRAIGLNVEFSEEGVNRFLTKVCKNVVGKAEIAVSNSDGPGNMYGDCYIPVVNVKRSGKVAEEIPIRFYNSGSSDRASRVKMILYSFDTGGFSAQDYENIFECEKALLIALEKTVAGKSYVSDYLTTYWDVYKEIKKGEINKTEVLATYELSDKLTVVIEIKNGGNAWGDTVYYTLEKGSSW